MTDRKKCGKAGKAAGIAAALVLLAALLYKIAAPGRVYISRYIAPEQDGCRRGAPCM